MKYSPLFWPIEYKDGVIRILDETLLPHTVQYIEARTYQDCCNAIKEMKTRAVGQVILVFYTFLMVLEQNASKKDLSGIIAHVAEAMNATRPTLSFKYLTDMILGWHKKGAPLEQSIEGFLEMLKAKRIQQAEDASNLLSDKDVVLTHCNMSGLMPLIAEFAEEHGKAISFFVTETRPYLQGSRLTAWELHEAGYPVTIIADNMVAAVMAEGKISKVIVGADHLTQNGDIANKIGTYQIALLAKHFHIPFYVICPPPSSLKTGKDIHIEIRPDTELLEYQGICLAPKGCKGYYPAFDVTPNDLITKHIYLEVR
ncbi:MAG TPA: S-methyl-5-thioribose-1-phosphate isomerase [Candidatus Omnitrophota bacterium]|nr:S-methyl-5-thioribose-1-phosphate isomerase [Candidatus Omnitrophota bacterium]HPT07052.1 S-methyl-5-thioribose-1-phosphate isomerase [Candidatus Omnitrophota bacterium]